MLLLSVKYYTDKRSATIQETNTTLISSEIICMIAQTQKKIMSGGKHAGILEMLETIMAPLVKY